MGFTEQRFSGANRHVEQVGQRLTQGVPKPNYQPWDRTKAMQYLLRRRPDDAVELMEILGLDE